MVDISALEVAPEGSVDEESHEEQAHGNPGEGHDDPGEGDDDGRDAAEDDGATDEEVGDDDYLRVEHSAISPAIARA